MARRNRPSRKRKEEQIKQPQKGNDKQKKERTSYSSEPRTKVQKTSYVPEVAGNEDIMDIIEYEILPENQLFLDMLGKEVLIILHHDQLNLFGQTFRPIFCGLVVEVTNGYITLDPVIIKMVNAPFHRFPTPLNIPMEQITTFTPFDCSKKIPLI